MICRPTRILEIGFLKLGPYLKLTSEGLLKLTAIFYSVILIHHTQFIKTDGVFCLFVFSNSYSMVLSY